MACTSAGTCEPLVVQVTLCFIFFTWVSSNYALLRVPNEWKACSMFKEQTELRLLTG